jgi:hypothetical protein
MKKIKLIIQKIIIGQEDLNLKADQRQEHLNTLKDFFDNNSNSNILNYIYEGLNILDTKAQSLLTFNSIILAILTFWIDRQKTINIITIFYYISFIFHLTSSILCLSISFLKWASTKDLQNPDETMVTLLNIREKRTIKYRIGLFLSIIAIIIVTLSKVIDLFINKTI